MQMFVGEFLKMLMKPECNKKCHLLNYVVMGLHNLEE